MPTLSLNGFLNSAVTDNISGLRAQIADRAQEATTGFQADLVGHLKGRIDQALLGDQAIKDNADDQARLELREIRLSITTTAMASAHDLSEGIQLAMQGAIGVRDDSAQDLVASDAKNALNDVLSRLGARHGERFMFSGDATATPPFADADVLLSDLRTIALGAADETDFAAQVETYFDDPAGGFQTNFYQGAQTASDPDSVLANQSGFANIFQGLAIVALAGSGEGVPYARAGTPALEQALERLEGGRTALVNTQADVGLRLASIESEKSVLAREETLLTKAFSDLAGKDQYEAATQLKELEANLEASYLLTSRLSNLSLLNYLR